MNIWLYEADPKGILGGLFFMDKDVHITFFRDQELRKE